MKLSLFALLAVAVCAGCAGTANLQSAQPPLTAEQRAALAQKFESMRDAHIRAKFAATDTNGDGVWDRAELAAESRKVFQAVSAVISNDKTGKLRHEVKTAGPVATEADYFAHHEATVFRVADKNGDGVITLEEYMSWAKAGAAR